MQQSQVHLQVHLDLCLRKTWSGKSHDYCDAIVFEKFPVYKMFSVHTKKKASIYKFLRFEELFGKAQFS